MKDAILGIDIGTSSIKCCIFDTSGVELVSSSCQYGLINPEPGIFEIDTEVLWNAVVKSIAEVVRQISAKNFQKYKITSIGICAMMVMPVLLDNSNNVIRPIIHWIDERLQKQYYKLKNSGKDKIISKFSGSALTGDSAPNSLDFVMENEPYNYKKINKFFMVKDFIRFKLTGKIMSDFGDASGTQLLDTKKWQWSDEIIGELGFRKSIFPELKEPAQKGGFVTKEAAAITGLTKGTPVAVGSGDGITTIFGLGTYKDGQTGLIVGSAGVFATSVKVFPADKNFRTYIFCHPFCDRWYSLMATALSGETLKWYLNSFLKIDNLTLADLDEEASKIPANKADPIFLPYILGSRNPYSNPNAAGVFAGLRHKHKRGHLTRAVMEGIILELLDILKVQEEILSKNKFKINEIKLAGGIVNSSFWTQLLADIFQKNITITRARQIGALGCAIMASVASGFYKDLGEATDFMVCNEKIVSYNEDLKDIYEHKFKIFKEFYGILKDKFDLFQTP